MAPVLLLTILFFTGLIVEAMTGAITAGEQQMDLFGVLVVATVTAFGGGVIRDLLLGRSPMLFISKPELLVLTSIAAFIMVIIARYFNKIRWVFLALDALGLITIHNRRGYKGSGDGIWAWCSIYLRNNNRSFWRNPARPAL